MIITSFAVSQCNRIYTAGSFRSRKCPSIKAVSHPQMRGCKILFPVRRQMRRTGFCDSATKFADGDVRLGPGSRGAVSRSQMAVHDTNSGSGPLCGVVTCHGDEARAHFVEVEVDVAGGQRRAKARKASSTCASRSRARSVLMARTPRR